jgi:hypothetical protein
MFNYDYRSVDLFMLREAGVRTFREVEEMIEGNSFADEYPGPEKFLCYTGFTSESKPLEVTIKVITNRGDDVWLEVMDVRRPGITEIINNFCRHCRFRENNT